MASKSCRSSELLKNCCFTLSDNIPGQEKPLMHQMISLGFRIISVYPLVIEKDSVSADDIEELVRSLTEHKRSQESSYPPLLDESSTELSQDESMNKESCSPISTPQVFEKKGSTYYYSEKQAMAKDSAELHIPMAKSGLKDSDTDVTRKGLSAAGNTPSSEELLSEWTNNNQVVVKRDPNREKDVCETPAVVINTSHFGRDDEEVTANDKIEPNVGVSFEIIEAVKPLGHSNKFPECPMLDSNSDEDGSLSDSETHCVLPSSSLAEEVISVNQPLNIDLADICLKDDDTGVTRKDLIAISKTQSLNEYLSEITGSGQVVLEHDANGIEDLCETPEDVMDAPHFCHTDKSKVNSSLEASDSVEARQFSLDETKSQNDDQETNVYQNESKGKRKGSKDKDGARKKWSYIFGYANLRISSKPIFELNPNLIVLVGDLFSAVQQISDMDLSESLQINKSFPEMKDSFVFHGGVRSVPLILQLLIEDYNEENFKTAFTTLKEMAISVEELSLMQSVVFTTSALYSSDFRAGADPTDIDHKLVAAFTHNVCEFLETFKPHAGTLRAAVAVGQDALQAVCAAIQSTRDAMRTNITVVNECGVCLSEEYTPYPLTCCRGFLCTSCSGKLTTQRCPFCRTSFSQNSRTQPNGKMEIVFDRSIQLQGYEKYGSYIITYTFPSGRQGPNHPQPGKAYSEAQRVAYLPASDMGTKVLRLLRVAFLRGLTFTIADSHTTRKKGVITWKDILHKTSLTGNSLYYGYPDPFYLSDITKVLADKGVTEENMSEQELQDSQKIFRKLKL